MLKKRLFKKIVFKDFAEYWHYVRHFSNRQRKLIFDSLPTDQQDFLNKSYTEGYWEDVFYRNAINKKIDKFKKEDKYDILDIRNKVLSGKSVYLPYEFWEKILKEIGLYRLEHSFFVLGGIRAKRCNKNRDVVLLLKSEERE
ncbi:MAG TPA: hypothetical protein VMZ91_02115 [Candidatus Paceibacterota bacterium]|nr:hypothetical protein [Candidatus Paceibacterota bacterium]